MHFHPDINVFPYVNITWICKSQNTLHLALFSICCLVFFHTHLTKGEYKVQSLAIKHVDDKFVGAHHDGCIGDLSDKMCSKSSVKSPISFFSKHQADTLKK